jgi:uncharacterized protein YeaO (DUF488 family)
MPILTKRWSEQSQKSDGFRLLICQAKPRAVTKGKEKWDQWYPELGPSKQLHDAFHGKHDTRISWEEFRRRYLEEMKAQEELIDGLAELVAEGKTITLLCSSACTDANQCHRSLLKELVDARVAKRMAVGVAQPAIV